MLDLIKWGLQFIRSATLQHVNNAAIPLMNINLLSKQLYEELAGEPGFDFALEKKGIMMYYKTDKVGEEEVHLAEKAKANGFGCRSIIKAGSTGVGATGTT